MKKFRIYAAFAVLLSVFAVFTACSKDDDEPELPEIPETPFGASKVSGEYRGKMTATVTAMGATYEGLEMSDQYQVIVDVDTAAGTAKVVLPQCSYTPPMATASETNPSITVEGVKVIDAGGGIVSLEIDNYDYVLNRKLYTVGILAYDKSTDEGTKIEGDNLNLVYTVVPGKMPGYIKFTFNSENFISFSSAVK